MPTTESDLAGLSGGNVVTTSGDKIGSIGQIYLDDQTGEPSFVAVNTGLLGTSQSLIPLRDATIRDGDVVVGYDKDMVTNAPPLEDDEGSLSRGQEEKLTTTTASATTPPREVRPGPPQRTWVRRRATRPPAETPTTRTTHPRRPGGDDRWAGGSAGADQPLAVTAGGDGSSTHDQLDPTGGDWAAFAVFILALSFL